MLLRLYKIRTYAQLDTWSRGTKQSQTKPILPDLPLPAKHKSSLTSFLTRLYVTTPQRQKQSQTNPISPRGAKKLLDDLKKHRKYRAAGPLTRHISTSQGPMPYHAFGTKCYDTASGAAERACNNVARRRLKGSATIRTSPASSAALAPRLCRLNNNFDKTWLQNHWPHEKSTCNPDGHPGADLCGFLLDKSDGIAYK